MFHAGSLLDDLHAHILRTPARRVKSLVFQFGRESNFATRIYPFGSASAISIANFHASCGASESPCRVNSATANCRTISHRSSCSGVIALSAHSPHHPFALISGHIAASARVCGGCRLHTPLVFVACHHHRQFPHVLSLTFRPPSILASVSDEQNSTASRSFRCGHMTQNPTNKSPDNHDRRLGQISA